mgnify:FL=1
MNNNEVDLREIPNEEIGHAPVITVVGVGGGGNNTIRHLKNKGTFSSIRLMIANTDLQHMHNSPVSNHIVLGRKLTKGLGAGMKPEKGKQAAEESYDDIKQALQGSDLIIIPAGLGGGTGPGAAPVFAKAAQETGALTIGVVTKPFAYEGSRRAKLAEEGLKELHEVCDSIVVIPNTKLLSVIGKNTGYKESMSYVDDVVARAVNGISSVILNNSDEGINVDFEDLRTVMSHRGLALMGIGEGQGENAADDAITNAIHSPLFDNMSINGSMGVIVNYEFNSNFPFVAISESMAIIQEAARDDADIIFGTMPRDDFEMDKVRVSIIATGFETNKQQEIPTKPQVATQVAQPQQEVAGQQAQKEPNLFTSTPDIFVHRATKISSGDYDDDDLDTPTYIRNQKD